MKNLIFGLVLCLGMTVVAQGGLPVELVNPGFESPAYYRQVNGFDGEILNPDTGGLFPDVPGWEDDFTITWPRSSVKKGRFHTGGYCASVVNQSAENIVWQLTNQTIAAGEEYTFSLWAWLFDESSEQPIKMSFFYVDGEGDHIEIGPASMTTDVPDDETWREYTAVFTVDEDAPESVSRTLGIAIEHVCMTTTARWMSYDDVRLERVLVSNPDPYDGETDVLAATNLGWELKSVVTNCDVYFGTDPNVIANPKVVNAENVEIYDPPVDLDPDTIYYWRVDARIDATVHEGDIWEFTTEPIILEDPCGLTVDAGDTAVFRVKATSGSTYLWEKLDSPDPPDNAGSTLTIDNVQKANEGVYYCRVTNLAFMADSARVNLMTRRLVARWDFDDNLNDSEGDWPGVYVDPCDTHPDPDADYVLDPCSIDGGKSLSLVADPCHVRITGSEDFFNFYPQGYTANAWVKTVQSGSYGCIASKHYRGDSHPTDSEGWVLNCTSSGKTVTTVRQIGAGDVIGTTYINDDQWHMVTSTYDAEAGVVAVYVDGKLETESWPSSDVAPTNVCPVVLGAADVSGLTLYEGLLDKTSIYSYALSPLEVAVLYTDVRIDESICLEHLESDFNDDCRVDLLDFAMFATGWFECNSVPDCMP